MATIQQFEDIEAWKIARRLTRKVYAVSKRGAFAKDFALHDQIRRASISVTSNIAEGFERGGTKEFVNFLSIAKGSAGEVRSQLYVAFDEDYIDLRTFEELRALTIELANKIGALMRYLQKSKIQGQKYR